MPSVSSLEQASAALAAAAAEGRTVRIGADLDAAGMNRVLEHESGDLTCTVEAGIRLSALAAALAPARQRLSLDPPGDPTIGACLAENLSGPLRHRFGAPRDLVLGVTLVLADGTIVNAGGKVVKNVAGYDLGKLVCGSRGRLAFIGRVSLRLHPDPVDGGDGRRRDGRRGGGDRGAARLAARPERGRHPPSRPRRRAVRGRRRRGRGAGRGDPVARRRRGDGRRGLGRVALAPGRGARADVVRAGRPAGVPRAHPDRRRPPGGGHRVPPVCRRRARRRSRCGGSRSGCASASTRRECSRDDCARRPALADERLRPLRLLPADVPDLPALERGDGLAAGPDPADGVAPRRHDLAQPDRRRPLRPLPRLHGLRDGLPFRRPVRQADRGDARDDRDRDPPPLRRPVRARRALQAPPLPAPDGAGAAPRAARPQAAAAGPARRDDRDRTAVALDREARTQLRPRVARPAGVSAFSQVACSPWCSGRSTRRRRGFWQPTATRSWRRRRAVAARSRCTPGAARKGARSRAG